ncbi:hypothetical protein Hte_008372 [Hypoxylon texense]
MRRLRRFKEKFKGRSRSADRPQPYPDETTAATSSSIGLLLIAENPGDQHELAQYPVDIIAVHGLNGDAFETWTHANGKMWIRDFLPASLPGCRIYTYGYPSKIFFNSSLSRVQEYARSLLSSVRDLQDDSHQALVFAHEDDMNYGAVLSSTIGIAFLGTPHRGSNLATFGSIAANIINTFSPVIQPSIVKRDLLDHLNFDSDALQDLFLSFRNRLANIAVVSFYETRPIHPLSSLVVDRASATIGVFNEDVIPLNENHRDLCRFPSETDSYKSVSQAIRRLASRSYGPARAFERSSIDSSKRSLNSIEALCISLFNKFDIDDYKRLLPKPAKGTCEWIKGHPLFVSWLHTSENALLWLTGHPGCGKTVLAYALAQSFEDIGIPQRAQNVLVYFCDDKVYAQTDAKAVLMSFIFQIVRRHRSLIQHVQKEFNVQRQSLVESFSLLWGIFLRIIKDLRSNPLYIVIDAIDECEEITCRQLLESIHELLSNPYPSAGNRNGIKFLVTSRPSSRQVYSKAIQATNHISIDEGQSGYEEDLQIFLQQRIEEICYNRSYPSGTRELLLSTLHSKTDQTFLWLHMILESLEDSLMSSNKDIQDIIAQIPPTLEKKYLSFLQAIPSSHQEQASRLLLLIVASSRHLSLDEINIAFTIDSSHTTTAAVTQDCQNAMTHTIQKLLGPFARILESKVSLVHQSAKDFLLDNRINGSLPPALRTIDRENAELQIAISCIRYLMLEDFSKDFSSAESSPIDSTYESVDSDRLSSSIGKMFLESEDDLRLDQLYSAPGDLGAETYQSIESRYKLYNYASSHWTEHLALCETSAPAWLRESAKTLLDMKLGNSRNWLHFYLVNVAMAIDQDLTRLDQLTLAAFFNLHETLVDLLGQEASQGVKDQALFWASRAGNCRIITRLLDAGADPNAKGPESHTPLTVAAAHSHLDCVRTLLADARTDPSVRAKNGRGALSFACGNGHKEMVEVLLNQGGCSADEADNSGATPLFWAAGAGSLAIIKTLAKRPEVDINHRDKVGRTALSWAACDGMEDVVSCLLRLKGIDANVKDAEGLSPLSLAARYGRTAAVATLVQSRRAEVDAASTDHNRRNAISWACGGGHPDALRVLLLSCPAGGGGVDDADADGWAPLAWAAHNDAPGMIRALAATGRVDVDRRDPNGKTALYWAVDYGHAPMVRALLREGADPALASREGQTPAMLAASFGREDILAELAVYSDKGGLDLKLKGRAD